MLFGKFGKKSAFFAVPALILALVVSLSSCLPFPKKFESTEDEHRYIQAENLKSTADEVVELYDKLLDSNISKGFGGEVSVDLELSQEAVNMIQLLADVDLSKISRVGVDMSVSAKDSLIGMDMGLNLSEGELIALAIILDMEGQMVYMTIPEILTKYLGVEIAVDVPQINVSTEGLPESDKVADLVDKYIDLAIGALGDVEKTDGTLAANGVEQSCKVYETLINERVASELITVVAGEARVDAQLKEVIVDFGDWAAELVESTGEEAYFTGESIYEEFNTACSELIEEIYANTSDSAEVDYEDGYKIITYVDGDNEVIGRSVVYEDSTILSYGFAESKGNFGFELVVEDETVLVGEGTNGKKLNGTFTLTDGEEDYITVTVTDLDTAKLDKGYICGTFDISLDAIADAAFDSSVASILSIYSFRIELDTSESKSKLVIALMSGENYFAKVTLESEVGKVEAPAIPSAEDVIIIGDETNPTELLEHIDFEVLLERLKKLPIPEEYINTIEQYLALFQMMG